MKTDGDVRVSVAEMKRLTAGWKWQSDALWRWGEYTDRDDVAAVVQNQEVWQHTTIAPLPPQELWSFTQEFKKAPQISTKMTWRKTKNLKYWGDFQILQSFRGAGAVMVGLVGCTYSILHFQLPTKFKPVCVCFLLASFHISCILIIWKVKKKRMYKRWTDDKVQPLLGLLSMGLGWKGMSLWKNIENNLKHIC